MSSLESQQSADAIIGRLRYVLKLETDADLARALGVHPAKVSKWKIRDSRPYPECLQVAQETGVCLEWLLTGEGPMVRHEVREAPSVEFQPPSGLAVSHQRVESLLGVVARLPAEEQERVMGELCARAEDAQQLADLKATVAAMTAECRKKAG